MLIKILLTGRGLKHNEMKQTYWETIVRLLDKEDQPLRAKDIILKFWAHCDNQVSTGTLRQTLMLANRKQVICIVKVDGLPSFYCLPQWFDGTYLKDQYKAKIYESKPIQIQKPARSLGRTTRLPIQQGEINP